MTLKGRNFLTLKDFTPEEITYLLDLAADLKEKKKNGMSAQARLIFFGLFIPYIRALP